MHIAPVIFKEGWRFGFIASHATPYIDEEDEDGLKHYFGQLRHLCTGHKAYLDNPELKKNLMRLLKDQLKGLKEDEHDDAPYHPLPDLSSSV